MTREIVIKFKSTGITGAVSNINKIAMSLRNLQSVSSKMGNLSKISKEISRITNAVKNVNNLKVFGKAFENIARIDPAKIQQAAAAVNLFIDELARGNQLPQRVMQIAQLAQALGEVAKVKNFESLTRFMEATRKSEILSRSLMKTIEFLSKAFRSASRAVYNFARTMGILAESITKGVMNVLNGAAAALQRFGSFVRMVGQGLQNFGLTMSYFISMPVKKAFEGAATAAIGFDDALVKIQKTSGIAADSVEATIGRISGAVDLLSVKADQINLVNFSSLSTSIDTVAGSLLALAKETPTPLNDLATLAEEAGRMGVAVGKSGKEAVDAILSYVRAANMIGVATDIAATDAIRTFGRLANAVGKRGAEAGNYIMRLATTVNILENTTVASASNITDAMERMVSASSQFNISGANIAAFAATLYEVGLSAEVAGTTFERITQYMTKNVEALADSMGVSVDSIRSSMDTDMVGAIRNVLEYYKDFDSASEAAAEMAEIFGLRAGRGVALLSGVYERLVENLDAANEEFAHGTSLVDEYYDALDSTANQIGIFKNNLQVASVILGKTFLPTINRVAQLATAAIQILSEAFEMLPNSTKLAAVGIAALLIVIPPLAIGLGSILFVIGMFISALGTLASFLIGLASLFSSLFIPVVIAAGAALLAFPETMSRVLGSASALLDDFSSNVAGWGEGLAKNIAEGIITGARFVIQAVNYVASIIARFFKTGSPPEEGPLSDIDKWGTGLMAELLRGFGLADFGILSDVGRYIKGFFEAFGRGIKDIVGARKQVAQLIDIFNKTGEISKTVLSGIGKLFGGIGKEVKELLSLQLRHVSALKQLVFFEKLLEDARKAREGVLKTYDDEVDAIAASGKSAEERSLLFREARAERNLALEIADDEIAAAEENVDVQEDVVDSLAEQVEWHKAFLDAMLDEAKLKDDLASKDAASAKALKGIGGALSDIDGAWDDIGTGIAGAGGALDDLDLGIEELRSKFDEARLAVLTFWAALTGGEVPEEAMSDYDPAVFGGDMEAPRFKSTLIENFYEWGTKIREVFDEIRGKIIEIGDAIRPLIEDAKKLFDQLKNPITAFDTMNPVTMGMDLDFEPVEDPFGGLADGIANLDIGKLLLLAFIAPKIMGAMSSVALVLSLLLNIIGIGIGLFGTLAKILIFVGTKGVFPLLGWIARLTGITTLWGIITGAIAGALETLQIWLLLAGSAIWSGLGAAGAWLVGVLITLWGWLGVIGAAILNVFVAVFGVVLGPILALMAAIGLLIVVIVLFGKDAWNTLKMIGKIIWAFVTAAWRNFKMLIGYVWEMVKAVAHWIGVYLWGKIKEAGKKIWNSIVEWFKKIWQDLVGSSIVSDIVKDVVAAFGDLWEGIKEKVESIWDSVTGYFTDIYDDVTATIENLVSEVSSLLSSWKDGGLATFLSDLISVFTTAFTTIKETISGSLTEGLNWMLSKAESAINGIIAGINHIASAIPGLSSIPGIPISDVTLPRLARGGIVEGPMAAIIGDVRGGEAIIPLRELPDMIGKVTSGGEQHIHIRIDRVDATDKNDIDEMIDEIARRLGNRATVSARLGAGARM